MNALQSKLHGKRALVTAGAQGIRVNAVAPGLILGLRFQEVHTPAEA